LAHALVALVAMEVVPDAKAAVPDGKLVELDAMEAERLQAAYSCRRPQPR
jgi:hypothetical protein